MASEKPVIPFSMWQAALLVATQSFAFGYVFSCLNACIVTGDNNSGSDCYHGTDSSCPAGTMYNDINLSLIETSLATSLTILGAWIGSLVCGGPSQQYGKKMTLLMNTGFFIVGAILSASGNIYTLFIGRLISGFGVGVASSVPSVLLSEMATPLTRGSITTLHQLGIVSGIFFASLLGYGMVTYVDHGWQYIQGFGCIPSLIFLLCQAWVPESPKWLLLQSNSSVKGDTVNTLHTLGGGATSDQSLSQSGAVNGIYQNEKYHQVAALLRTLRDPAHDVDKEISEILADAKAEALNQVDGADVTWAEVFAYKKGMIVGVGLMLFQAITGINSVVFYSSTIFGLAGFSQAIIGSACVGAVNLCTTVLTAYLIDTTGRKSLLLIGTYIMLGSLLVLSIVLLSPIDETTQGIIAVLAVLAFVCGFALGMGAVVWTVMSEIMPTRLRMKAVSLFLSVNWGCNLIIGLLTLTAIDGLGGVTKSMDDDETASAEKNGVAYLYFIFAGFTAICLAFIHICVPETKGKTAEELMGDWSTPLLLEKDSKHHSASDEKDTRDWRSVSGGGSDKNF